MWKAGAEQIPKLTVRVRFQSPALMVKAQVRGMAILACSSPLWTV